MVALNVGSDFKQRWLGVPEAVRQAFIDDLSRICDVLKPDTEIQAWLSHDEKQQQLSYEKINVAYAELKAQLIEEARVRKQLALEKALEEKRAAEAAYAEQLKKDEERQRLEQTRTLGLIRQNLDHEVQTYASRYHKNPDHSLNALKAKLTLGDEQILSELDSLRLRLELESETLIEHAVTAFRAKLHIAAQEEIEYILKNSEFSEKTL